VSAFLDFAKQSFNDIRGSNIPPMRFREVIKGQTGFPVSLHALNGGRINALILQAKSGSNFNGFLTVCLIENSALHNFRYTASPFGL
jgi:hypothetical protein